MFLITMLLTTVFFIEAGTHLPKKEYSLFWWSFLFGVLSLVTTVGLVTEYVNGAPVG